MNEDISDRYLIWDDARDDERPAEPIQTEDIPF